MFTTVRIPDIFAPATTLKLTKMRSRTRYDIAGYESGGLPWGEVDPDGDGYLVATTDGKILGEVYKWDDGKWSASRLNPRVNLGEGAWAFESTLYSAKTRTEALGKLIYWTLHAPGMKLYE